MDDDSKVDDNREDNTKGECPLVALRSQDKYVRLDVGPDGNDDNKIENVGPDGNVDMMTSKMLHGMITILIHQWTKRYPGAHF